MLRVICVSCGGSFDREIDVKESTCKVFLSVGSVLSRTKQELESQQVIDQSQACSNTYHGPHSTALATAVPGIPLGVAVSFLKNCWLGELRTTHNPGTIDCWSIRDDIVQQVGRDLAPDTILLLGFHQDVETICEENLYGELCGLSSNALRIFETHLRIQKMEERYCFHCRHQEQSETPNVVVVAGWHGRLQRWRECPLSEADRLPHSEKQQAFS